MLNATSPGRRFPLSAQAESWVRVPAGPPVGRRWHRAELGFAASVGWEAPARCPVSNRRVFVFLPGDRCRPPAEASGSRRPAAPPPRGAAARRWPPSPRARPPPAAAPSSAGAPPGSASSPPAASASPRRPERRRRPRRDDAGPALRSRPGRLARRPPRPAALPPRELPAPAAPAGRGPRREGPGSPGARRGPRRGARLGAGGGSRQPPLAERESRAAASARWEPCPRTIPRPFLPPPNLSAT